MTVPIDRLVRSRRKTIAVLVHPDGSVEVRAPISLSDGHIREFVEGHAEWVRKQQARAARSAPPPARKFIEGEKFLYRGQTYPLRIVSPQRPVLQFDGKAFRLGRSALPKARETLARWYKAQALEQISEQVRSAAVSHGLVYQKIRISSARTRWGSCSSKGTLSFTWRLMMAPPEIIEYVIVHELVHTRVHNHSKDFWNGVAKILPDYKARRTWLRKNGKYLSLD